jgi:hypothetical protein
MSNRDKSAFPVITEISEPIYRTENGENQSLVESTDGLTKRELFAALCLINSNYTEVRLSPDQTEEEQLGAIVKGKAEYAVMLADALIAALDEEKGK